MFPQKSVASVPKNHRPPARMSGASYVLLTKEMQDWGRVPQQQADMASIIASRFEVGVPFKEWDLFQALEEDKHLYPSLEHSCQDVSYLFRYYRGLSCKRSSHAGYLMRNFIR